MNRPGPVLALLLGGSVTVTGASQASAPAEAGGEVVVAAAEELAVLRENLVDRVLDGTIRSLVVVALRDGEVVWSEGFGWSDAQRSVPAGLDTVYPVGSLSKSITGLAATLLLQEGRLSLDTPVRAAAGDFPLQVTSGVEREPVVLDLAAMKAGMPHGGILWLRDLPDPEQASARVVRDFAVVATTPGAAVTYSNYTSGLLERVVAHASGTGFTAFVQARIVEPLGMTRTVPSPLLVPAHSQVATVFSDDRALALAPLFTPIGGQGYYSCASDLTTLARAHLGRRGPEEAGPTRATLAASRWPTEPGRVDATDHLWMGWGRFRGEGSLFELTNGQVMSSTSALLLCVEKGAGVVCLTNSQWANRPGGERLADSIAFQVMDILVPGCRRAYTEAAARAEAAERTAALPAADRAACVGEWEGELVLGEQRFAARLHVTPELSATLWLDDYEARCSQLQSQGPEIVGDFASSGELHFFGERGRLSRLSVGVRLDVEARHLAGHVLASTYSTERATVGSGAGLLTLMKRGATDASQPR